jgi:26S proteasome regulatory subunit N10
MPLESCMILLDCSEYMRNGDYVPTRLSAQQDAANLLVSVKTQSHPESTVGVSAGTELLVSPTDDVGKILNALHDVRLVTSVQNQQQDVCSAVQVASLALKHRRNKNGSQRIVLFVGSPVTAESRALIKAGRQLKKNNVGIDVVCMGELETNEEKMRELVDAANGRAASAGDVDGAAAAERTCHLVTIPAGVLPSDVLASSPILNAGAGYASAGGDFGSGGGEGGAAAPAAGAGGGFSDFGVDPNMDPELAMALRISMEEERGRQERVAAAAAAAQEEEGGDAAPAAGEAKSEDAEMTEATTAATAAEMGLSEEEALLQQALAMSMNENEPTDETKTGEDSKPAAAPMDIEDEDTAMQMALQMSMTGGGDAAASAEFQDPAFVNELLGSMPGVDPNDPEIQQALRQAVAAKKQADDEKKQKQEEDKKE